MTPEEELKINPESYEKCVRAFDAIEGFLGLNIKVFDEQNLLQKGDIFLYNHFARFETLMPPYIAYKNAGVQCRCIADYQLFEANEKFGKFLKSIGVVPNNYDGLLPFLAAEILRGRKVVIFPEGGMVKNKKVLDEKGDFNIFSPTANAYRKHHRGAAVLAFTLDLFKHRILSLFEDNDEIRIQHWCEALNLKNRDELWEAANKPTLIIPANITFYPIRISDNILTKGFEFFSKKWSAQMLEELAIEGNLLLKNTDMDIRMGAPIIATHKMRWFEKMVLKRYFLGVDKLSDLFGLKNSAETWAGKTLSKLISKEADRLRDEYMEAIYTGVTVNINHLTASLINTLIARGKKEITQQNFRKILYLSLKNIQKIAGVNLHRSITWPGFYKMLLEGKTEGLERFIDICVEAELMEKTEDKFIFLPKLYEEHNFHEVRLENPVEVSANEAAPIQGVHASIIKALAKANHVTDADISTAMFDDETRSYHWNKERFSHQQYQGINSQEEVIKSGKPYLLEPTKLTPKNGKKIGILMVHGYSSSPAEMKDFAEKIHAEKGYTILGMRLPGHGTSPWDMQQRSWQDWLGSLRRNYEILSGYVDEIVIVGFSAGGALSLLFSLEKPEKLKKIVSVCAPLAVQQRQIMFTPLLHGLNKIVGLIPHVDGIMPFYQSNTSQPEINYKTVPIRALKELKALKDRLKKNLAKVTVPVELIQSDKDVVTIPNSGQKIYDKISSKHKNLQWLKTKVHGVVVRDIAGSWGMITAAIEAPVIEEENS